MFNYTYENSLVICFLNILLKIVEFKNKAKTVNKLNSLVLNKN